MARREWCRSTGKSRNGCDRSTSRNCWSSTNVIPHVASESETDETAESPDETPLKLAIVGRRNVGKSTFINCLAESERVIVSEVPGTTRDSIDVRFEMDEKSL